MLEKIKKNLLAISLAVVSLICSIAFVCILAITDFLTPVLLFVISIIFLGFSVLVFFLAYNKNKKVFVKKKKDLVKKIIAIIITIIMVVLEIVGGYSIYITHSTIKNIFVPTNEYHEIGIYVRDDDSANKLEDITNYNFGILEVLERESTDKAVIEINKLLSTEISINEYVSIDKLMDSLISNKQVNAIILNKSLLGLLEDLDDHSDDLNKIREIHTFKIEHDNISSSEGEQKPPKKNDDVFTAYISGIDCKGSISIRSRTDANVIATVNMKTGQILLVTTPRDYYVPLSISNGIPDKLTHSGIYGINVSRDTHEMLYDIDIDYYFKANFDGLKGIVDALGGIEVYSEYPISVSGYHFKKGYNYLDGTSALVFARTRKQVTGGARQRAKNHMAVITGVINKATSPAILTNYKSVLNSASGMFETDMPYEMITKLIQNQITNGTKWNITSYSVDGTGTYRQPYSLGFSVYVMIPDQSTVNKAKELMAVVRDGGIPKVK